MSEKRFDFDAACDDEIKKRRDGLRFNIYESDPCPHCNRVRVGKRKNGKRICEKCHWDVDAKAYDSDALYFRA